MFSKVLIANRGEIAVRALRAAREIGSRTVAVFPHEDRWSEHRMKAEEAYQIGEPGHPVRAYLDPEAIVAVAVQCGADAVYPGYGFLSENPALAEACAAAGMRSTGVRVEPDGANLGIVGRLIEAGDVRVRIDAIHRLDDAVAAFERVETGHARGKVVLSVR